MPRMTFNLQGYLNCAPHEVEGLEKQGWRVVSDKEFQEVLDKKRPVEKSVTIIEPATPAPEVQTRTLGRPRKNKTSILNDGE